MNEEINKLIEEFEARLQTLKDEYEEDKAECEFEEGDIFWSILRDGQVMDFEWKADKYHVACYEQGNVFKTREEALFEVERRKVLHELKQLGRPFEPLSENWCIYINGHGQIDYYSEEVSQYLYGNYYFNTKEEATQAVQKIGKDIIREYLFN